MRRAPFADPRAASRRSKAPGACLQPMANASAEPSAASGAPQATLPGGDARRLRRLLTGGGRALGLLAAHLGGTQGGRAPALRPPRRGGDGRGHDHRPGDPDQPGDRPRLRRNARGLPPGGDRPDHRSPWAPDFWRRASGGPCSTWPRSMLRLDAVEWLWRDGISAANCAACLRGSRRHGSAVTRLSLVAAVPATLLPAGLADRRRRVDDCSGVTSSRLTPGRPRSPAPWRALSRQDEAPLRLFATH